MTTRPLDSLKLNHSTATTYSIPTQLRVFSAWRPPTHPLSQPSTHLPPLTSTTTRPLEKFNSVPFYSYSLLHYNAIDNALCVMTTHPSALSASSPPSIHLTSTYRYIHNDDETIRQVDIGTILLVQSTPLKRNWQYIPFCSKRRVNVNPQAFNHSHRPYAFTSFTSTTTTRAFDKLKLVPFYSYSLHYPNAIDNPFLSVVTTHPPAPPASSPTSHPPRGKIRTPPGSIYVEKLRQANAYFRLPFRDDGDGFGMYLCLHLF